MTGETLVGEKLDHVVYPEHPDKTLEKWSRIFKERLVPSQRIIYDYFGAPIHVGDMIMWATLARTKPDSTMHYRKGRVERVLEFVTHVEVVSEGFPFTLPAHRVVVVL